MMIRKATEHDTRGIWQSHVASIRGICARDYRPDQIELWSAFQFNHGHWVERMNEDHVLVIEHEGEVAGFCHAAIRDEKTAEIVGLYLSPSVVGRGFGRSLVNDSLKYLGSRGAERVVITATKTASGFYQRMGFSNSGPEKLYETRGTRLECQPMEMMLSSR